MINILPNVKVYCIRIKLCEGSGVVLKVQGDKDNIKLLTVKGFV